MPSPADSIRAKLAEWERLEDRSDVAFSAIVRRSARATMADELPRARRALAQIVNDLEASMIAGTPHAAGLAEQRLARVAALLRGE